MIDRRVKCSITGGTCSKLQYVPRLPNNQIFYSYCVKADMDAIGSDLKALIKDAAESNSFKFYATEYAGTRATGFLCEKICLQIKRSAILVADLSCYDRTQSVAPNVAHEIGLAQGIGKEVIFVADKGRHAPPSNVQGLEILWYPRDVRSMSSRPSRLSHLLRQRKLEVFPEIDIIDDALTFQSFCKQAENLATERMFISSYIPSIAREVPVSQKAAKEIYLFWHDRFYLEDYRKLINKRRLVFEKNLSELHLKCREIYSKSCIERYAREGIFHHPFPRQDPANEVKTRIKTLIARLEKYDEVYDLRLLDEEPPHKFFIKKDLCVIADNTLRRISKYAGGMITTIPPVVERYQQIFEDLWSNADYTNRKMVKEWLIKQLDIVENRTKRKKL